MSIFDMLSPAAEDVGETVTEENGAAVVAEDEDVANEAIFVAVVEGDAVEIASETVEAMVDTVVDAVAAAAAVAEMPTSTSPT